MFFLLRKIGFKEISIETYRDIYEKFGGSLLMDPSFLLKLDEICNINTKFFALFDNEGIPTCAFPVWGDFIAGDRKSLKRTNLNKFIDLGRPSIIIPSSEKIDTKIRFKTNYLLNSNDIKNAKMIPNRYLALYKDYKTEGITSRFRRDLRRYWKHFEKNEGLVKEIQEFTPKEISEIFTKLHLKRWGYLPPVHNELERTFTILKNFLFGSVLFMNNEAVSIQIIYYNKNKKYSNFEYINSGVDMDKSSNNINLGNLLIDLNTSNADQIAKITNTELIYSFGLYNVPYKERWCKKVPLYKIGF